MASQAFDDMDKDAAVPIVLFEDHKFKLDVKALKKLLLCDEIKDRSVVILSVAGAFRKGKSFLLNFFLKYLYYQYGSERALDIRNDNWTFQNSQPLLGFSWKGGSEQNTKGILMWSKVFLTTLENGEDVAIILMDTQGTFDSESTVKDCATIFALSTMISSTQIYNLSQNIQEDDMEHLQLFTEYGRLSIEDTGKTPFQKLLFLIRDWSYPYEAEYGEKGGKTLLQKRLKITRSQHPDLQSIRLHIKSCFSELSCFLMPHPGLKVASNPNFDGKLSDIEDDFKTYVKELTILLLAPQNLRIKEINGQKVKAKDVVQYLQAYVDVFGAEQLPEPKSVLIATAEANNLSAVAAAKDTYKQKMEECCGRSKPYVSLLFLEQQHNRFKLEAINQFKTKKKMGSDEFCETYKLRLEEDLADTFKNYQEINESKHLLVNFQTPSVFIGVSIACYILTGVFEFLGIYFLASVLQKITMLALVILISWIYVKCTRHMTELEDIIDIMSATIWENAIIPIGRIILSRSAEHAMTSIS